MENLNSTPNKITNLNTQQTKTTETTTQNTHSNSNNCSKHQNEILNFYCDDHKVEICQYCLLESHIGHKIIKAIDSDTYKLSITTNRLNSIQDDLTERLNKSKLSFEEVSKCIDEQVDNFINVSFDIKNCIKFEYYEQFKKLNNSVIQIDCLSESFKSDFELLKKKGIKSIDIDKWTENIHIFHKIKEDSKHFQITNSDSEINKNMNYVEYQSLVNGNMASFLNELKNKTNSSITNNVQFNDIENPIDFILENKSPHVIKYKVSTPNANLKLVKTAQVSCGKVTNPNVINVLESIDRAEFVKNNSNAYNDTPLSIGWNTTISAPHMHMFTIDYIAKFIKTSLSNNNIKQLQAIDIGSGSGFMTIAISKLLGPNSITIALDHIQDILNFSKANIKKSHNQYIENGRIKFLCDDGLTFNNGENGKYHVIHVGAACTSIPQYFIDLLHPNGMIWIPVGAKNGRKKMMVCIKDKNGEIKKESLMDVSYSEMQSVEEQLENQM